MNARRALVAVALAGAATAGGLAWHSRDRHVVAAAPARLDLCARAPAARPSSCDGDEATLLFAGDTAEVDAALPTLAARGFDWPFVATAERVRRADLAVANLEAPLFDGELPRWPWQKYRYAAPVASAGALARAGLDVVGLANNHALDGGAAGLASTLQALAAAGLVAIGAGPDEASARRGVIVDVGAAKIGLLARAEPQLAWDLWLGMIARGDQPGIAALDGRTLAADVAALHKAGADLVVLFVHWGENYAPADGAQRRWARVAAAAGVDLVVGHHPHVAQGVLVERGVPIALSLGNWAFGTPGHDDLDYGVLLEATVRARRLVSLALYPVDVQNRRVGYQPRPLDGAPLDAALADLAARCAALGTPARRSGDHLVVDVVQKSR